MAEGLLVADVLVADVLVAVWRDPIIVIALGGLLTYATRAGGAVVLARISHVPPRLTAALDAIPAAVLTALVVPALVKLGPIGWAAGALAVALSLRFGPLIVVFVPTALVVLLRYLGVA